MSSEDKKLEKIGVIFTMAMDLAKKVYGWSDRDYQHYQDLFVGRAARKGLEKGIDQEAQIIDNLTMLLWNLNKDMKVLQFPSQEHSATLSKWVV